MLLQLLNLQAWAAIETGDLKVADQALLEAQALLDQGLGSASVRSQLQLRRGELALARQDHAGAHKHSEQALTLLGFGSGRPERSLSRVLLGASHIALASGRLPDAERFAREALQICERVARGPDSSADVGESLLALVKASPRSPESERRERLERAIRCLTNGLGTGHPLTVEARVLLERFRAG
jgi:tetratricopeptide (TPR) repeat protein